MKDLDLIEEMILWAVWRLGDNAYGVTIRKQLSERTGRLFPYGTLYGVLAKLTRKAGIYITHLKPSEMELTMQEIDELVTGVQPRLLQNNQVFEF